MSYLKKFLFIKQVGHSKHFNLGSMWLPPVCLGEPSIAFFEDLEEQGDVVIDSGGAERPLGRPLKMQPFNHKSLHQDQTGQ